MRASLAKTHPVTGEPSERPRILIVGAGIGGATLGMLLTKAGVPFDIYERTSSVKPLGSALFFNATTAKLFKQCGIYDQIMEIAKLTHSIQIANENREIDYILDYAEAVPLFGSSGYIVSRPKMYELLLSQVPKERIHMGKKVTAVEQTENGVVIHFEDKTTAKGDILVGADGAYSKVRECIYDDLRNEGRLLASDDEPLPFTNISLVGQTRPLDPTEFPNVSLPDCQFIRILGDNKPYASESFKNTEWGPQAAEAMCTEVRNFPIVSGGDKITTVGDLIDLTPKEYISKVMLEEKVFETWHNKRVVLIGDACHKINPSGGSGANNAIHDAATLANWLNVLSNSPTTAEIEHSFEKYKAERLPWVKQSFDSSLVFKVMVEASFKAKLVKLVSKYMPSWMSRKMLIRMTINQPEVSFLPPSEYLGSIAPAPQPSYDETLAILQERKRKLQEGKVQSSMDPVETVIAAPEATAV
ncbi:hypothetical protein BGW39_005508 [Mortierella sp. 14UC]|nr:hypothetical protein BGW39_005508 [Mortierella sp. 14UC]